MQHLHIQNKHICSVSALVGWCLCALVHSLEHTQKATVTSYYGLLTLCPLWRSTSEVNFFKFSHLFGFNFNFQFLQGFPSFGCNFNFQFFAITMEHQNPLRPSSYLGIQKFIMIPEMQKINLSWQDRIKSKQIKFKFGPGS